MSTQAETRRLLHLGPILILFAVYSVLVGVHSAVTPIFEAPDEVWHYAYVRWLASGNGLPPLDEDLSGAYQEAAQPPFYYLVAAGISRSFDDSNLQELMWHNPGFGYQAPNPAPDNKNMLVHTPAEAFPWQGAALAIHATRAASWLFGLVTVAATYGLGYEVTRSRPFAVTAGALVALHPQFVFISGVVSNDSAAAALATVSLWVGAQMLRRHATWWRVILAGVTAGLGALTKTSVLPIVPLLAVCIFVGCALERRRESSCPWRKAVGLLVGYLGLAAGVAAWWYMRNLVLYGDALGLGTHTQTLWGREEIATLPELLPELPLLWRSFWAAYGWGHVFWTDGVYLLLSALTLPLIAIAVVRVARSWTETLSHSHNPLAIIEGQARADPTILPASLAILWMAGIALMLLRWMQQVEAPHGRLLFPAIGAWAVTVTLGLWAVGDRDRSLQKRYRVALISTLSLVAAVAPAAKILGTFAPPRLRSTESIASACQTPSELVYAGQIALLCVDVEPRRVRPGDDVSVRACWTSYAEIGEDYTVYVHLLGPALQRFAERHTYPGLGTYPTSLWQPDRAFCDVYEMRVEPWAETPVRSQVEIGLYDEVTGERAPVATTGGQDVVLPIAGSVDIVPQPVDAPELEEEALAELGPSGAPLITLADAHLQATAEAGQELEVTLDWVALAAPDQGYVAFIHLRAPGDSVPLAQSDAQPRSGWFPTEAWQPGDRVPDTHQLRVPATVPAGTYSLWAGLYRSTDGTRLPAYGATERYPDDLIPLGSIEIR